MSGAVLVATAPGYTVWRVDATVGQTQGRTL
ncbi:hypothetical protein HDC34_000211 [Pseudoclavibacter sp. JAI123]|nr:hypothetical protein [Pseudoclavibacter sp. JAI123]